LAPSEAPTLQTSQLLYRLVEKAIFLPSGEKTRSASDDVLSGTMVTFDPSGLAM